MAKFRVSFIQHNVRSYVVEADDGEEAKEKAYDKFLNNLCYFKTDADYDEIEVEALKDGSTTD